MFSLNTFNKNGKKVVYLNSSNMENLFFDRALIFLDVQALMFIYI